ncbi:hypothetical protein JXM83_01805 [Candidatus Woesearchaeota archaeon]|nr:hypothetical protein [Candidatus Woesearchaeota archaeon]
MNITDSKKFKKLLLYLYKNYPNSALVEGVVKKVIVRSHYLDLLVEQHIFDREKVDDNYWYSLGPNALPLISSWQNENVAIQTRNLSLYVYKLTGLGFWIALTSLFFALRNDIFVSMVISAVLTILFCFVIKITSDKYN